jgi:nucleotide-binding universal stress UspA family protein
MSTKPENLVVIGLDGSAESLAALRWGLKEAVTLDANVEVVHCYLPQTLTDFEFSTPHELHTASAIMLKNEVEAALREMPQQPDVRRSSVLGGPAKELVEHARNASLLVLGVHGHTSLRDLILGRVAQACLRNASCPVAIVDLNQHAVRYANPNPRARAAS